MRQFSAVFAAVLLLLIAVETLSAAGTTESEIDWLPLKRSEFVGILSQGAAANPPVPQPLEDYIAEKRSSQMADAKQA